MKFGGTSVEDATAIDRIAGIVKARLSKRPLVVVSAMSKVTDGLLAMAVAAGKGDGDKAVELCHQVANGTSPPQANCCIPGCSRRCTVSCKPNSNLWSTCCAVSLLSAS